MLNWFLKLLERCGRREILVDVYTQIHWERYYLLYYETPTFNWLPNLYLHIYPISQPDSEDHHSHPWSTCGFPIKGGYRESVYDTATGTIRERVIKRFRFAPLSYKNRHRLIEVIPGTMSLFGHWFQRQGWKFYSKPHPELCDYCRDNNGGVCIKPDAVLNFAQQLSRAEADPTVPFSKRRSFKWTRVTPELLHEMARRRKALARLGRKEPATKAEKYDIMREIMVKRNQQEVQHDE